MPTTVDKYLQGCQQIVDAKPKYKLGASDLKECDCIGMDKYAFRQAGVSLATSGTNYSARKQVKNLRPLVGTGDLSVGDIVSRQTRRDHRKTNCLRGINRAARITTVI